MQDKHKIILKKNERMQNTKLLQFTSDTPKCKDFKIYDKLNLMQKKFKENNFG